MDELTMLLDRFAGSQSDSIVLPPVSFTEAKAHQRTVLRSLTSLSVVIVLVIGLVIGLASVGLASEPRPGAVTAVSSGAR